MTSARKLCLSFTRCALIHLSLLLALAAASPAHQDPKAVADTPQAEVEDEIDVVADEAALVGVATSASEGRARFSKLEHLLLERPGDALESVPGLTVTQHSGAGKANQYFLRGFNLDHGTDFAARLDGVPLNMVSHGHGQGYIDLNPLIPELIHEVRFRKGPFSASSGDFSSAGAVEIDYVNRLPGAWVGVQSGSGDYTRGVLADSTPLAGGDLLWAVEAVDSDGPWTRPDEHEKRNALLRFSRGDSARGYALTLHSYAADWFATDQIPARAVSASALSRHDTLDPTSGGRSDRLSLTLAVQRSNSSKVRELRAYAVQSDFELFSNFTFFLDNPVNGDQFEQNDRRFVIGGTYDERWATAWGARTLLHRQGAELRLDSIENGLFATQERRRLRTKRRDQIEQAGFGLFREVTLPLSGRLRVVAGVRLDALAAQVRGPLTASSPLLEESLQATRERASTTEALLSPRFSFVLAPPQSTRSENAEFYLNLGTGFHSNDARSLVSATSGISPSPQTPSLLARTRGVEVGVRSVGNHHDTKPTSDRSFTFGLFQLDSDSELVFVGDEGTTTIGPPARRRGFEITAKRTVQLDHSAALRLSLESSWTRARFRGVSESASYVPGALKHALSAGALLERPSGLSLGVELKHRGSVPLSENGAVRSRSSTRVDGAIAYRFRHGLSLAAQIFNLFDRRLDDISYLYESRLSGEPASGVSDVHFHPALERSFRVSLGWSL